MILLPSAEYPNFYSTFKWDQAAQFIIRPTKRGRNLQKPPPPEKKLLWLDCITIHPPTKITQIFYPSTSQNRLLNPFSWFCKPVLARCAELGPADIWSLSISDMPFSPLFFRPFFPLVLFHRCDVLLSRHQCKQGLGPDCPRSFHRSSSPERWRNKDDPWLGPIVGPEEVNGSW